jgi:hypothetical protein
MSTNEDKKGEESKETDYDEDKDQLEEKQEEEREELNENETTNPLFFELGQKQQIRITHKR